MKRVLVAALILAGSLVMFGRFLPFGSLSGFAARHAATSQDTINRSFQVGPGGSLVMDVAEGSVEIEAVDSDSVDVEVRRRIDGGSQDAADRALRAMNIDFAQNGNSVTIRSESPRFKLHRRVEYKIKVPQNYNVDVQTSGGGIAVSGVSGETRGRTSGGGLRYAQLRGHAWGKTSGGSAKLTDINGPVEVETSGGSLHVENIGGAVTAHTSGGSITARTVRGGLVAQTSGGSLRFEDVTGPIDVATSGGNLDGRFSSQPEADSQLKNSGGSVVVSLPDGARVNLDAAVSGGKIETDFPVEMTIQGKWDGTVLKGPINGGGPLLYCRTSGSRILVRKTAPSS